MSTRLFDLTGRTAFVTGSSGGLGLTIARGLGRAGARIVLNGRNEGKLARAVDSLARDGLQVSGRAFDVTRSIEIDHGVSAIEDEAGPIHVLVNNAGVQIRGDLAEVKEAAWRSVIENNLTSAFLVSRRVVRGMIARRAGKIVNVCSLMSEVGRKTTGPYAAAKGGLKMLTKAMAVDWTRHNIQVNGVGPGYFMTEMTRTLAENPEFDAWLKNRTPAARWGQPEELVGTVVYLASEASSFVSGQVIYVDGGVLATL
jgi:gluconate 5-dehydrogenase